MRCPKCKQAELDVTSGECPNCGFHGDAATVETLWHLNWLLEEMTKWGHLNIALDIANRLRRYYTDRQKKIEIELGLRLPMFAPSEAREGWVELFRHEALFERLRIWRVAGHLKEDADPLPAHHERVLVLRQRLAGYNRLEYGKTRRERLELVDFILEALPTLQAAAAFTSLEAQQKVTAALLAEKANLEALINPSTTSTAQGQSTPTVTAAPAPPRPPKPPAQPFGERLRRSILSERTLQALIFLGIFLLFTAAISFVISGWDNFSPPLRMGIPAAFTGLFLGLGWLVRRKTKLYRSGIALSAIAALLVPINAYTVYVNGNVLAVMTWAQFWLLASIFSLLAYILLTLQIQSRFFGYLVVVAAGSLILAGMEVAGLPRDGYGAGLSVLALLLLFTAIALTRWPAPARLRVFVEPFRYLGLWLPAILMPLTMGQWLVTHAAALDDLQRATTITWLIGGFIFGWGAVRHRSVGLGRLAALALPVAVYLGQLAIFHQTGIHRAWHAFGLASLTPLYLIAAYKLSMQSVRKLDPMLVEHSATASAGGWLMVVIAALLSLFDLTSAAPAAATHFVLAGSIGMSAILWKNKRALYWASFFSLTATSFLITELDFKLEQLGIGWASLALLHLFAGLWSTRFERGRIFTSTLVTTAYAFAALAVLPAFVLYDGSALTYTLGNFIALSLWGASFAYRQQHGFYAPAPAEGTKTPHFYGLLKTGAIFHWFAALPLPYWLWVLVTTQRPADFSLALAFAALAWGMVAAGYWLCFAGDECRRPWRLVGFVVSVAAPLMAFSLAADGFTPSVTLLAVGLLYFTDAFISRKSLLLYPAGLVTAWGLGRFLEHIRADGDVLTFVLILLVGVYLLGGLWLEKIKHPFATRSFLAPLYHTAHFIAFIALVRIYFQPLNAVFYGPNWTDSMQLWGAIDQLTLAALYLCFTWGHYNQVWAFISVWLAAAGGAFLITLYSSGQGSLAAKGTLIVTALILAERTLHTYKHSRKLSGRVRAHLVLFWRLYRAPLLFTGWCASVFVIFMALFRNYITLGGGRTQQIWAAVALLMLTALYAFSARLFKQARFVWFAAALIFIPWTILTHLGWFVLPTPKPVQFAVSWMLLAWVYFLVSLLVKRFAAKDYVTPLTTATHLLMPFALLLGLLDVDVSRITICMAIALYAAAALQDHWHSRHDESVSSLAATKFLYPMFGLVPLWSLYWLSHWLPAARTVHYGLLLLSFGALGLLTGQLLERFAPRPALVRSYGLPAYLIGYCILFFGLLITAFTPDVLVFALLYTALLLAFSAWLFKHPIWLYPATMVMAIALIINLNLSSIPFERHGWWLIGLAAIYLSAGWLLQRFKLKGYAAPLIYMAFGLIALGLPPSSRDQVGAFWGYGSAALLLIWCAFWLRKPLILYVACALIVVPYASALQRSPLDPRYYGLALLPGAALALGVATWLDARYDNAYDDFPWHNSLQWPAALVERILNWWALPFYLLGFGMASVAPLFSAGHREWISLGFLLQAGFYTWAVFRFRGRGWLLTGMLSLHLAMAFFLSHFLNLSPSTPAFWLGFLPLTVLALTLALWLAKRFNEGSPFEMGKFFVGWSRPLFLFFFVDLAVGQLVSLSQATTLGVWLTLAHLLLIGLLASVWGEALLVYISLVLGLFALMQWRTTLQVPISSLPSHLAWLAFGYGVFGFGYRLFLRWQSAGEEQTSPQPRWRSVWEIPLQRSAMLLSTFSLGLAPLLGIDLVGWTIRGLFGADYRERIAPETIWMMIWTFSLVGLLYTAAATVYRRIRLGYVAVALLLTSWFTFAFYVNTWAGLPYLQWYALPAGLYLLAISYVEWTQGNKAFARWLDYAALLLLMGSLFWQTLSLGLLFCTLMIVESLALFAWGMFRRLRRFFYMGIAGVILAVLAEFVNSLQNPNGWTWIIGGGIGLLVITAGILAERRLEAIKAWDQRVLETWE